jgi:hypothetical protein
MMFDLLMGMIAAASLAVGIWNSVKIREVHLVMNSRLDQLLKISTAKAYAEGAEFSRLAGDAKAVQVAQAVKANDGAS